MLSKIVNMFELDFFLNLKDVVEILCVGKVNVLKINLKLCILI